MPINQYKDMTITNEFLIAGQSGAGGWNKRQLALLGVDWPPVKGWKHRIIGTEIPDEDAMKFLSWKGQARDIMTHELSCPHCGKNILMP